MLAQANASQNGHAAPCPGCADLLVAMRRSLAEHELLITVRRLGTPKEHLEACVMGLVLKELATSMIP